MASASTLPLRLPKELYREIANNLARRPDRNSLLSLALVSADWHHESQRILFSSINGDWLASFDEQDTYAIHIIFLQAIVSQPERLGRYVRFYSQLHMAHNPDSEIPLILVYFSH